MIDVTLLLLFFFVLSGGLTKGAKLLEINIPPQHQESFRVKWGIATYQHRREWPAL
jgi:hypothetical protein